MCGSMRNKRTRVASSVLLVVCAVMGLLVACAEPDSPDALVTSSAALSAVRPSAQVRLGQKEFERALAARLSRSAVGLSRRPTPLGGGRIDLRDRFQHVSIVHKRPDGSAETVCVTTPSELHAVLGPRTKAASP